MKLNNPTIIRKIVASLLWGLLILCFFICLRTMVMVQTNIEHIKGQSITPTQYKDMLLASETAKGFIREWATFDRDKMDEYTKRISSFGKEDEILNPGRGTQRCNSVNVTKISKVDDHYRVQASISISKLLTVTPEQANGVSETRIQSRKPGDNYTSPTVSYWQDSVETVEIAVKVSDNSASIIGWPVIIANASVKDSNISQHFTTEKGPQDFSTFSQQMLEMYYSGKDLGNYCSKDIYIFPVGGFNYKSSEILGIKQSGNKITALIKAVVTSNSLTDSEQVLVMEAQKIESKWFLVRLGGY